MGIIMFISYLCGLDIYTSVFMVLHGTEMTVEQEPETAEYFQKDAFILTLCV